MAMHREGHDADLVKIDLVQVAVAALLFARGPLGVETDRQAVERARLHQRVRLAGELHLLDQEATLHVQAAAVLRHLQPRADRVRMVVLAKHPDDGKFIPKPYERSTLLSQVRTMIERGHTH